MPSKRAMTDAQKEARRADILRVALHRFSTTPYAALSMADTADEAGVAKGTLYLYFRSKEEMFLSVYTDQLNEWFDALDQELKGARGEASIANFVHFMGESLARRPQLLKLIAILHTVLEQNLGYEAARRFRQWLKERLLTTGPLLETYLPFLEPGQGARLLLKINALVIGFQHLAEPSGVVRKVLDEEGMELFHMQLEQQLLETLSTLLMGLAYEAKYKHE
ncbi:MAG TPA: TetR family transcriptional regulator [Gammaproteobacteria bacterium]|nr:TetR family transcriptional regulator [Gammaproteobacteria bacterium]